MRAWLTPATFAACVGAPLKRAQPHYETYLVAMAIYGIESRQRTAMFLANIGHECMGFFYAAEIWGPTDAQKRYERDFGQPWPRDKAEARTPRCQRNRLAFGLGNTQAGDGEFFAGHGHMQYTGRYNHMIVTRRLRERFPAVDVPDFEAEPLRLCEPQWAALSACDYADMMRLNFQADQLDFDGYCDYINLGRETEDVGDANGYPDRARRYDANCATLGIEPGYQKVMGKPT